jgi:hypothetical protein
MIVLFGGTAGSGKSTIARQWCVKHSSAVHIERDSILSLIVAGLADPQIVNPSQQQQYSDSVRACCALARSFEQSGYIVAIDDVLEPYAAASLWMPELEGFDDRLVILHPRLEVVLARGLARRKMLAVHLDRSQHAAVARWPSRLRVDSSDLSVEQTLDAVSRVVDCSRLAEVVSNNGV